MYENVPKRLRWLAFNFPHIDEPKDESDKICNCINLYCTEAADAIEVLSKQVELEHQSGFADGQIAANRKKSRWIPVTERLPEERKAHYLCYLDDDSIAVCYWSNVSVKGSVWEWHNPNWKEVTHWMPLPEPPNEG